MAVRGNCGKGTMERVFLGVCVRKVESEISCELSCLENEKKKRRRDVESLARLEMITVHSLSTILYILVASKSFKRRIKGT